MELKETFQKVKAASKTLGLLTDEQRNEILQAVADALKLSRTATNRLSMSLVLLASISVPAQTVCQTM